MSIKWRGSKVKSIHVFSTGSEGTVSKLGVLKPKRKGKRKIPKWARPLEKQTRSVYKALARYGAAALKRHDRSNKKKKNGWLKDLSHNHYVGHRKSTKGLGKAGQILRMH
jgi:hypothetical protein